MKKIQIMMFLILGMIFASHADTRREITPEIDKRSKELWDKYIHNKDDLILDNWGLVRITLLRQGGKQLDARLASFATVVFSTPLNFEIGKMSFDENSMIIYAQNLKGSALTDGEKKKISELYIKIRERFGDRSMPYRHGTFAMGKAFYLGFTVNDSNWLKSIAAKFGIGERRGGEPEDWVERAVYRISKFHGWKAILEEGENIQFDKYKKAVNRNIPILIERDNYYRLVVGYLQVNDKKYIITADLSKTPIGTRPPLAPKRERDYFSKLPPDDPWRIGWENKLKHTKFPCDLRVTPNMPLHPGFRIELFEKGKYHAYFIHGWRKSLEAWEPEIRKIVGNKKKDASNSK